MNDPFGSIQGMIGQFKGFMQNPTQFMIQRKLNIPPELMNNPNEAIQYLMNSGKLTQEQYNWAVQQAKQIENNPQFAQFLNGMNKRQ
jgi:hypothetical protein